jgi:hypothetical protein
MTKRAILIRGRSRGRVVRLRLRDEPAKLRVCRACLRAHTDASCPTVA